MAKTIFGFCLLFAAVMPHIARADSIFVDATGPGAPTITSTSSLFVAATINPQGVDVWGITFVLRGDPILPFAPMGIEFLDPVSNAITDSFGLSDAAGTFASVTLVDADLYTSDTFATVSGRFSGCPALCSSVVYTGGFELAYAGFSTSAGTFDFYLKSDVAQAVPEPETYALMLAGLGLLGFAARRRKQQTT